MPANDSTTARQGIESAMSIAWDMGSAAGDRVQNIWSPEQELPTLLSPIRPEVEKLAGEISVVGAPYGRAGGIVLIALGPFAWSLLAVVANFALQFLFFVAGFLLIGLGTVRLIEVRSSKRRARADIATSVYEMATQAAHERVEHRKSIARAWDPILADQARRPRSPAPAPQPFGVSHSGAEQLVAQWIRHFGEVDAEVTRQSGDGGIDVESMHYIAQVKNYAGTVGVAELRELGGVAALDGRKALFFTSGTYAVGAVEFASKFGIALFTYSAEAGTVRGLDDIARRAIASGL